MARRRRPRASRRPPARRVSPTALPSASPSAAGSPTADPATVYAQIEAQVQQIRELSAKTPVEPKLLDDAALKANVAASFEKDNPPELVAANQRVYQLLGLIPDGTSLKDLYLKLLGSQVAGYYDSDTKELYVVSRSGGLGPTERITFAHEFDHALQDQNFGLDKLQLDAIGESDRSLARLSVAEGDATLLMSLWAGQPDPGRADADAPGGERPGAGGDPGRDAGHPEGQPAVPVYRRPGARRVDPGGRRLGGRRQAVRRPAGLDRAGPSPGQVRRP